MKLVILSSERVIYSGTVEEVVLPGVVGEFTVLENHAPLFSTLKAGNIVYILSDTTKKEFPVKGGIVEVNNNQVRVCIE